ncbi:MAG TPA: sugar transferase [Aequorivita sp.]|nr:sugar transferase [Aequorivita sp.]
MKRTFDIFISSTCLIILSGPIAFLTFIAFFDTGKGFFLQTRIGQHGKPFTIYKLRSMQPCCNTISTYGRFLRRSKLDELPQLLNIFLGQMSFVGPRPDIPGYYDQLRGADRKVLQLKPGLCSRAAIKYFNEEHQLSQHPDPLKYNDEVIFPDKVKMNLDYYHHQSFREDLKILWETVRKMVG